MALRVRSRAPQDENAAMPHLSGKMQIQGGAGTPMAMAKTGGLKHQHQQHQQHQQQGNPERKTLSNITNTLKPAGGAVPKPATKLVDSENSSSSRALFSSAAAAAAASGKKTPAARVPLRNITNANAGPSPGTAAPPKELKQAKPAARPAAPQPWAQYDSPLADPAMERLVREWAAEGVEVTAGATGDEMERLRRKRQDQEIGERMAAARALRTPLPSSLYHSHEGMEMKEVLEMDPYGTLDPPNISFPEFDWGRPSTHLDAALALYSGDDAPSFPDDWGVVKTSAPAPRRRLPGRRTWL